MDRGNHAPPFVALILAKHKAPNIRKGGLRLYSAPVRTTHARAYGLGTRVWGLGLRFRVKGL